MDGNQGDHVSMEKKEKLQSENLSPLPVKRSRPISLRGRNIRIQTGHSHMYITVNTDPEDPTKIFEVFAQISKPDPDSDEGLEQQCERVWVEALCRMISTALRYRVPQEALISQLKNLECIKARDGELGTWIKSPADGIAQVMEGFSGPEDR